MLIYNTTYQTGIDDARNFVFGLVKATSKWKKTGILQNPVLRTSLVTKQDSECFHCNGGGRYSGLASLAYSAGMHLNEK